MNAVLLAEPFVRIATRAPEQAALWASDGRRWSYGELEARTRGLAGRLRAAGMAPGVRVGIWMRKSPEAVAALIGASRAGAVYVPLDPLAPGARIERLAADCGIWGLMADADLAGRARAWAQPPAWVGGVEAVAPPEGPWTAAGFGADEAVLGERTSQDLAYILYTSGSTGVPKGVMLTHAHALNFIAWAGAEIGLGAGDRVASHAPFHFDLSVFDLWATLSRGAEVCLLDGVTARFPQAVGDWILDRGVTVWYSVPSALVAMLPQAESLRRARLRAVIFAGEVFPTAALRHWQEALPAARFHNWYGPTETNVCAYYRLPGGPAPEPLPIGRAVSNFELAMWDEQGEPVAAGEAGYLWARGPGVLAGYWGDEARTGAVTRLRSPAGAAGAPPERWYNTGDLVRQGADGQLYFQGRRDAMVKCRGYRVSLLEVEQALESYDGVAQAGVVAWPAPERATQLVAFLRTPADLDVARLRAWLSRCLPAYMIPDRFEVPTALPVTSTGKLDRQALARLAADGAAEATGAAGGAPVAA